MNTDPIADLLTRIRNAIKAHHENTSVPYSKLKENLLKVMKNKKFIKDFSIIEEENGHKNLTIIIENSNLNLTLRRISKPGQRIYIKNYELKPVKNGLGILIISTPKGVLSNLEAKKANVGGELLCEIY